MFKCKICCKEFKTNWQLQRHFSKKIPCEPFKKCTTFHPQNDTIYPQNDTLFPQNDTLFPQNDTIYPQNDTILPQTDTMKCKYCCEIFNRVDNYKRHLVFCKEKEDVVRCLEINLNIEYRPHSNKHGCRFCYKIFSRKGSLGRHYKTCKVKQEYREKLELQLKDKTSIKQQIIHHNSIHNTYNDNRTININCLGNENVGYVTTNLLKELWKEVKSDEEGFAKTIKIIHASREHPENHNIIYTNLRSNTALVKVNDNFEYRNINDVLKDVSANALDMIVLNTDYDDLHRCIKEKYEKVCDDDELNKQAATLAKTELYNSYKIGDIKRPNVV